MPARLLLVESAGSLTLVDRDAAKRHALHDGRAGEPQVWLADVRHSGGKVTGSSG